MTTIETTRPGMCIETLEAVAELYEAHARRVRRLVHLRVTAPDALVEDACQIAWSRLVSHRARVRGETAEHWVLTVAVHEALRLIARQRRDVSLQALDAEEPSAALRAPDLLDEIADSRARLLTLRGLPERQQRLLWLQGLGFSYTEIAERTGDSQRTVERQLHRARRTLAATATATAPATPSTPTTTARPNG